MWELDWLDHRPADDDDYAASVEGLLRKVMAGVLNLTTDSSKKGNDLMTKV